MGDGVPWPSEGMIMMGPRFRYRFTAHNGDGCLVVTRWDAGVIAHVTLLTGDALFEGGRCTVLVPDNFQLDAKVDGNLVTTDAEFRLVELFEANGVRMDWAALVIAFGGLHLVTVRVFNDLGDSVSIGGGINGRVNFPRLKNPLNFTTR